MMQGPIRRLPRERVERRDDALLPSAWVGVDEGGASLEGLTWLAQGPTSPMPADAGSPVLIMLGSGEEPALEELQNHAGAGRRVYVLVPSSWGDRSVEPGLLRAPKVLFRRIAEVPASGVHTSHGGRLWIGGSWSVRLDDPQTDALRQIFLRLFWHEATQEAWSGGKHLAWRVAGRRPFEIPDLPRGAPLSLVAADARLGTKARGALVHLAAGAPPEAAPRRLWFPAGADHHDELKRLSHKGAEVVWQDRGLPDLMVDGKQDEILLPGRHARLRILPTSEQVAELARVLEAPARWTFGVDLRVGDLAARGASCWLPGEPGARGIQPEQGIDVADVPAATLRSVPEASPETLPAPQPLALAARYRWTVVPPVMSAGSVEDALVGRWRKVDGDWMARIGRAREALHAAEKERGRVGRTFSRLVSAMLGFERTHARLLAEIATMEQQRPSAIGPSGAPEMLDRLAEIEERTRGLQGDLAEAERKAREEEEREKQEAAWRSRVDAAQKEIPLQRKELAEAEQRAVALAKERSEIEEQPKPAEKKAKKDQEARRKRLRDDQTHVGRDIERLRVAIAGLERRSEEPFTFTPPPKAPSGTPSSGGGRFVPQAPSARPASSVPDQALPEVGALRSFKGQRYLGIENWEDLAAGEQAATRLSARLVAMENK